MNNVNRKILIFAAVFVVLALIVGKLYDIGIHRPPLKYANIPLSTQDYLDDLSRNQKDQGISFANKGPFGWSNEDDLGVNDVKPWKSEEDENFIVYYHPDKEARWQELAQAVLGNARENIDFLEDLFGTYFFAADMNGRKLAIYLPENAGLYATTIASLMEQQAYNAQGSLGITISQIGPLGCMTKGIVLHPDCFNDDPYGLNGFVKVLQHEMAHYVFFSALDYGKEISHYMWVSEGIAEYFCDRHNHRQVSGADSIDFITNRCQLDGEFPHEMNAAYWAGESFFRYMEKKKGKKGVREFLQKAYVHSTDSVFILDSLSHQKVHDNWVKTLNKVAEENDSLMKVQPPPVSDEETTDQTMATQSNSPYIQ